MKLNYAKYNPSGNTTIIIDNRQGELERSQYASLSVQLMEQESLCAEQVGYLENPTMKGAIIRLHMMGGEFCGNATRCLAKMACDLQLPGILWEPGNQDCSVPLEVSGYPGILTAKVESYSQEEARIYGAMPLPRKIGERTLEALSQKVTAVEFDGILHFILEDAAFSREMTERLMAEILRKEPELEAAGLMFFNSRENTMIPVVYVREVDSLVYESSCGSGTTALAAAIFHKQKADVEKLLVDQPGGSLEISFGHRGGKTYARLGGVIRLVSRGEVWI